MNKWIQLINLRESKDWTQAELAKKLDVTNAAISQWENGASKPTLEKMLAIASLFNTTIEFLLGVTPQDVILITRKEYNALVNARNAINTIEKRNVNISGNTNSTINYYEASKKK